MRIMENQALRSPNVAPALFMLVVIVFLSVGSGCSRTKYRLQADRDAYGIIAERNQDPAWAAENVAIEMDQRSRFYDPYDPDCPPMPPDDPTAHTYMHLVDGKRGWRYWHDNGLRPELENPGWRQNLEQYVELTREGEINLNLESALSLAYMHSPLHQRQLETLYLSSLDVAEERFRLDTQFFGGYGVNYSHQGRLLGESNELTVGRPDPGTALRLERQFASAGQLLAGFANSFVYEFTGPNTGLSSSLVNISLIQPLLRGAGRDIALEQLTRSERNLLGNLRAYAQFRQGFFTQIAIGELGVNGPSRFGSGTALQSFSGRGGVDGYLGLLLQRQRIQNINDNLNLLLRTRAQLEVRLRFGSIDLIQVDLFRQQVESERTNLLRAENDFQLALDNYKTDTLGLPPDLEVDLDTTLIEPFQLIPTESSELLDRIVQLQTSMGTLPVAPDGDLSVDVDDASIAEFLDATIELVEPVRSRLESVPADLEQMELVAPVREMQLPENDEQVFREEREQLRRKFTDLTTEFAPLPDALERLRAELTEANRDETVGPVDCVSATASARPRTLGIDPSWGALGVGNHRTTSHHRRQ